MKKSGYWKKLNLLEKSGKIRKEEMKVRSNKSIASSL